MTDETRELVITGTGEPTETVSAVDWDSAGGIQPGDINAEPPPAQTYRPPRSKWDFTDGQRIVIGVLIWLNIIVLVIGYLAITGQLTL